MWELRMRAGHHHYSIWFGEGIIDRIPAFLEDLGLGRNQKCFVITDSNVGKLYLEPLLKGLQQAGYAACAKVVPAGESAKRMDMVEEIIGDMLAAGCDRRSVVFALGGGVVGDLAGFVASVFMRGIPYIQIPTTVLAHDSSVGGKVAVNHPLAKNIIGSFHHPLAIFYDMATLKTLPEREVLAGLAEVIKIAFIMDESFFRWLIIHREEVMHLDHVRIAEALYRACALKVKIVEQDEREEGIRAYLNFGHTIGHAIEAICGYEKILHGEAVAIGMAVEARIAEGRGIISREEVEQLIEGLHLYRLPTRIPAEIELERLIPYILRDKKNVAGSVRMILPHKIGEVELFAGIMEEEILAAMRLHHG